jgi:uncharacterized membrane protein
VIEDRPDYQRAATGYLVWPLAVADVIREPPDASQWSRIHARQAVVFGIVAMFAYLLLLALPLLIVIAVPEISSSLIVALYALGLLADFLGGIFLFGLALYYSGKAGRGELFRIPLVGAIADRVMRVSG